MARIKVLLIGTFSEKGAISIEPQNEIEFERLPDKAALQALIRTLPPPPFHVILCGAELVGMGLIEMGQTLRMLYPFSQIFYIGEGTSNYDKKDLLKNGFTNLFALPEEESAFKGILNRALLEAEARLYAPIRLIDVQVGTRINFEIRLYLPRNNRFIPYISNGDIFDFNRLERLKTFQVNTLFVPISDIQKFRDYSAQRLYDLEKEIDDLSSEEKEVKLKSSVNVLIQGLVHESTSKLLNPEKKSVETIRKIIEHYLTLKFPGDWQQKIRSIAVAGGDIFEHGSNVSAYAALFSLALKVGDQKALATAGILHDLGLAYLPQKLQNSPTAKMSMDDFKLYKTHPELSLKLLQERGLEISDVCRDAILYHHVRWDGGGYPKDVQGRRPSVEIQILALANRFDELTCVKESSSPSLRQTLDQIELENIAEPELVKKLREIIFKAEGL